MSKIRVTGPWAVVWSIWHAAWLFGIFWVPFFWPDGTTWDYRVLYTLFLPLELIGAARASTPGVEVARTLSQVRQWVAQAGKGPNALGWKALASGTALVDAAIVWYVAKDVHPAVGAVLGTVVWLWLSPHFGYRERVG
jgi:hypothetical protein